MINSANEHSTLSFRKVIFKVPVFLSKAEIMTRIETHVILYEFWFSSVQQKAFLVFTWDQSSKFWIIFAQLCRKAKIRPHTVPFPPSRPLVWHVKATGRGRVTWWSFGLDSSIRWFWCCSTIQWHDFPSQKLFLSNIHQRRLVNGSTTMLCIHE